MSWQTESLGNLLASAGNTRAGTRDLPVLSITMHDGLVDQSAKFKKRVASQDISSYRVVEKNELVVGFPIDEGVLGFQTRYPAAVVSPAYGIWKLRKPTETHIPFLERYLRSSEARQIYAKKMRGAVARRRSINKEDFLAIEIPFPPLAEQMRITAVLDMADALRRQRQESLPLTEKLLESIFIDMFGDPATNPKSWPVANLGDLTAEGESINYGVVQPGGDWPGGVPLVRAGNIANPNPDPTELKLINPSIDAAYNRSRLKGGELLIGCVGSVGSTCIAPQSWAGANIARAVARINLRSDIQPEFMLHLLRTKALQRYFVDEIRVVAQPTLNIKQIREAQVFLPPKEQREKFAQIQRKIVQNHRTKEKAKGHLQQLFTTLQQRALRGELDLSRFKIKMTDEHAPTSSVEPMVIHGRYKRPGIFIAPAEVEAQMMVLEEKLDTGPSDSIPWSEDFFKYRILSQVLQPPYSFSDIWEAVYNDMEEASYETVKTKVFEYVEQGCLEQKFDEERKEIVFYPVA